MLIAIPCCRATWPEQSSRSSLSPSPVSEVVLQHLHHTDLVLWLYCHPQRKIVEKLHPGKVYVKSEYQLDQRVVANSFPALRRNNFKTQRKARSYTVCVPSRKCCVTWSCWSSWSVALRLHNALHNPGQGNQERTFGFQHSYNHDYSNSLLHLIGAVSIDAPAIFCSCTHQPASNPFPLDVYRF